MSCSFMRHINFSCPVFCIFKKIQEYINSYLLLENKKRIVATRKARYWGNVIKKKNIIPVLTGYNNGVLLLAQTFFRTKCTDIIILRNTNSVSATEEKKTA